MGCDPCGEYGAYYSDFSLARAERGFLGMARKNSTVMALRMTGIFIYGCRVDDLPVMLHDSLVRDS